MRIAQSFLPAVAVLFLAVGCNYPERTAYRTSPDYSGQVISSPTASQVLNEADRSIESALRGQLSRYGDLSSSAQNIHISALNGVVTLTGTVPTERERQMIDAMVRGTSGVVDLNDQLVVQYPPTGTATLPVRVYQVPAPEVVTAPGAATLPNLTVQAVTDADRSLAERIVDRLRTDTVLPTLFPSVNISVSDGRVTLRGIVQNEQQRRGIVSAVQRASGVNTIFDETQLR